MKKLFYTAIVAVAFSSMSMANTIAEEKELDFKKDAVLLITECAQEASERVANLEAVQGCLTPTQYAWAYQQYYNACVNRKKSISAN